jgi:hypothetical protein
MSDDRNHRPSGSHRRRAGAPGLAAGEDPTVPGALSGSPAAHAGATAIYRAVLCCWLGSEAMPADEAAHVPRAGTSR